MSRGDMAGTADGEDSYDEPIQLELQSAPSDKGNVAYLIFFLLGTGFLLPWNAFITAIDYFSLLYTSQHVDTVFSVAYMIPNLALLIILVVYIGRTPPRTRISAGFFAYFLLVVCVPLLDFFTISPDGLGTTLSFALTVGAVSASGAVDALIQGSLFGMAAELPPLYTQAVAAGTSASGFVTSALRIFTKLSLPSTETGLRYSAYLYFTISSLVLLVCIGAYFYLNTLPIIKHRQQRQASFQALPTDALALPGDNRGVADSAIPMPSSSSNPHGPSAGNPSSDVSPLLSPALGPIPSGDGTLLNREENRSNGKAAKGTASAGEQELVEAEAALLTRKPAGFFQRLFYLDALVVEGKAMSVPSGNPGEQLEVLSIVWPYACSVTLVYVVTLSIFPGFISELKSDDLGSWYPVLLMGAFNIFDFFGKMTPVVLMIENDGLLFALVLGRFLFYPLYSVCLSNPTTPLVARLIVPLLTSALGFSNGLLTSLLMMAAPTVVREDQAEAAGTIMVLFLVVGLTLGSIGAWIWVSFSL